MGQFWTPITPESGSILHADSQTVSIFYFFPPKIESQLGYTITPGVYLRDKISEPFYQASNVNVPVKKRYLFFANDPVLIQIRHGDFSPENRAKIDEIFAGDLASFERKLMYFGIGFLAAWVGAAYMIRAWGNAKEKELTADKFVRGSMVISSRELDKKTVVEGGRFKIADVHIPRHFEILPSIFMGKPQQGKSTAIKSLLDQQSELQQKLIAQGKTDVVAKRVIFDTKGDFVSTHYNSKTDQIFAPTVDARSVRWTIFNDIVNASQISEMCATIIPEATGSSLIWSNGARLILKGLILHCIYVGKKTNKYLSEVASLPPEKMKELLQNTPGAEEGAAILDKPETPTSFSFFVNVLAFLAPIKLLENMDGPFSVRDWLSRRQPGTLFILSSPDHIASLKPVLALLLNTLLTAHKGLSDDRERRIWYFLDELGELPKIPGLVGALNFGPSKGLCALLGFQSYAQIDEIYSPKIREAMISAAGTHVIYCVGGQDTAQIASDIVGKQEVLEQRQTLSTGIMDNRDGGSSSEQTSNKACITPDEIKGLKPLHCILKFTSYPAARIQLIYKPYPKIAEALVPDTNCDLKTAAVDTVAVETVQDQPEPVAATTSVQSSQPAPLATAAQGGGSRLTGMRGTAPTSVPASVPTPPVTPVAPAVPTPDPEVDTYEDDEEEPEY